MLVCDTCKTHYQCPQCDVAPKHAHEREHHSHRSGDGNHLAAEELEALQATKNINDWKKVCEDIRVARNGSLPEDWMRLVLGRGGCAAAIIESWKEQSQ